MIPKYTDKEYDNAKSQDKLPLVCEKCNDTFYMAKKYIKHFLENPTAMKKMKYCTPKCYYSSKITVVNVNCRNCNISFTKLKNQFLKTNNHFCSQSCAATYNNTHKTTGTRVSKLELWLQTKLSELYPDLEIHYNHKNTINSELDIYIPSLKLAFELNGIFHYEPIYDDDKLSQIQNNDNRKFQACLEQSIELCVIDISQQKYFKEKTSQKYLTIIIDIINQKRTLLNS